MRDKKKTPLQSIIDGDLITPVGAYHAKLCSMTNLKELDGALLNSELILSHKAKEARENGHVPDGDNLTQDRLLFTKARAMLNEQ